MPHEKHDLHPGADWLQATLHYPMSDFGRKVADLIGELFYGIYHLSRSERDASWSDTDRIELVVTSNIATYDGDTFTRLLFLCHDACIRCEIRAVRKHKVGLFFTRREVRTGSIFARHPTIETALAAHREQHPAPEVADGA